MFRWFLATIAFGAMVASATAAFTITVVPSVGPDQTNASFTAYGLAAPQALASGANDAGSVASPSYYIRSSGAEFGGAVNTIVPPFSGGVTGLWQGDAFTGGGGGAFATQTGNQIYYGLIIRSDVPGQTFTAADVEFLADNPFTGPFGPVNLAPAANSGSGFMLGRTSIGGPLVTVTSAATALQELYYVGNGFTINNFNTDYLDEADLEALMAASPGNSQGFTTPSGFYIGAYRIIAGAGAGTTGVAGVDINGAPAPATIALMGLGLGGIIARYRRRKVA